MRFSSRFLSASLGLLVVLAEPTGAGAASFRLTVPGTGAFDQFPSVAVVGTGFQLAWQRYESNGLSSIMTQSFGADGKATAALKRLEAPKALAGQPRLVPAASGRLGLVWVESATGLTGTTIMLPAGTLGSVKTIAPLSSVFYDVARLSSGRIALTNVFLDKTVPTNLRVRAAVTQASGTMTPMVVNEPLYGSDNPYTSPGSRDSTVVGDAAGGAIAVYRDRNDGRLYAVQVSSTGRSAGTRTRLNTTEMKVGGAAEMANFGVQAVRLTNGRYAVAWTSQETSDGSLGSLRLRYLDSTGKPYGAEQRVNASLVGRQMLPRLLALPGGRVGIAWYQMDGRTRYHRIRWFGSDGKPLALPKTLRSETELFIDFAGSQLLRLADGRVLQVWRAYDDYLKRYAIRGEFLIPPP